MNTDPLYKFTRFVPIFSPDLQSSILRNVALTLVEDVYYLPTTFCRIAKVNIQRRFAEEKPASSVGKVWLMASAILWTITGATILQPISLCQHLANSISNPNFAWVAKSDVKIIQT